jgi:hypothetical protein
MRSVGIRRGTGPVEVAAMSDFDAQVIVVAELDEFSAAAGFLSRDHRVSRCPLRPWSSCRLGSVRWPAATGCDAGGGRNEYRRELIGQS